MIKVTILLLIIGLAVAASEPTKAIRTAGDFRITVTLKDVTPTTIISINVGDGNQTIELPSSLFDDLVGPHIGGRHNIDKFRIESNNSTLIIRITAGEGEFLDDHAIILTLPFESARRISRIGDVTGYIETRSSTPITR